jgi:hypothetical protein
MKKILLPLLFIVNTAFADECKITTVVIERDGQVNTESATVCKENGRVVHKLSIGDQILEDEVGRSKIDKYFTYNNNRCRMFTENVPLNKKLRVYHGVICQVDATTATWMVVDKW